MTIPQAVRRKLRFVRLPWWEPGARMELPLLPDGCGPWAVVRDAAGESQVFMPTLWEDLEDRWTPIDEGV